MAKGQLIWELSKQKIQFPLKKGELYFLIQYYHDKRRFRYYMTAKTASEAREKFENEFGSANSPCEIHKITLARGNDQSRLVIYTHVVNMMDEVDTDSATIFRRVGMKFNMTGSAVKNLFYKMRKKEHE